MTNEKLALPWAKWEPDDWMYDEQLSGCSAATRGIWVDAINWMLLGGTYVVTGTIETLARRCRATADEMAIALAELKVTGTADVSEPCPGQFSLVSRRRLREVQALSSRRLQDDERRKRWREKKKGQRAKDVPPCPPVDVSLDLRSESKENRSTDTEETPASPPATRAAGATKPAKVVKAKTPDPLKADTDAVVAAYRAHWVETRRPEDSKPPDVSRADWLQTRKLVKAHGREQVDAFVRRYLADANAWLAEQGHPLRHLPSRLNGYRATAAPRGDPRQRSLAVGYAQPVEHYTESKDRTNEL